MKRHILLCWDLLADSDAIAQGEVVDGFSGRTGGGAQKWLSRPIAEPFWVLIIDGTYFHVRRRGSVEKEPSRIALGISENNRRSILAIEPGTRDSADAWRSVFASLKERGLDPSRVKVGVMDGLPGLENAFMENFPAAVTARCWFHSMQNALAKTPKRLQDAFHILARKIMYADGEIAAKTAFSELEEATKDDRHRAVERLRKDLNSPLSHYKFPRKLWRPLKATNAVERIQLEFKRRARAMDGMTESTLSTLAAFTVMLFEMSWKRRDVDTYAARELGRGSMPFFGDVQSSNEVSTMH